MFIALHNWPHFSWKALDGDAAADCGGHIGGGDCIEIDIIFQISEKEG